MPANTVIKHLHCLLTAILLSIICSFLVYQYMFNITPRDIFISKQKLSSNIWLYITKYDEGGATVGDIYRFYLDNDITANDLNEALKELSPFLEASTNNIIASAYGNTVNIQITGRVYSFTNAELFYKDGAPIIPIINLTARGIRN